jgi:bilirubin oxidase
MYPHSLDRLLTHPSSYTDRKTGTKIDFYEVKIREFTQNLFPDLGDATLLGYDGMAPGPTFRVKKGTETVVRFVNEYYRNSAVHLHGSFSRAPFDGWAEDTWVPRPRVRVLCVTLLRL